MRTLVDVLNELPIIVPKDAEEFSALDAAYSELRNVSVEQRSVSEALTRSKDAQWGVAIANDLRVRSECSTLDQVEGIQGSSSFEYCSTCFVADLVEGRSRSDLRDR